MSKAHVKQNMGGAAAAVEAYRNAPTPNVIVLEATVNREILVDQLDELSQFCDAGTKVIVLGKVNDIVLYRLLMSRGVSQLYLALGDTNPDRTTTIRAYYKPLVLLIWIGGLIMAFGGMLSLSDRRLRVGSPKLAKNRNVVQPAE